MSSNLLNNRRALELGDAVRRLLGDTSSTPVIPAEALRELVIAEYILTQHELGFNPQIPLRPDGSAMLSYALAAGDYQTTQEGESDIVAVGEVYNDRSLRPMQFKLRAELEAWINNDVTTKGAVTRGVPIWWTMRVDWAGSPPSQMKNRLLVYPAADSATTIYWPRTVVDTDAIDPTNTTSTLPLSYQGTWGLEFKLASLCVRRMDQAGLAMLKLDRGFADVLWAEWLGAKEREKRERAQFVLEDYVRELNG